MSFGDYYRYLRDKGLSHEHAMGWVANIQGESSGNPAAIGDRGTSFGLNQWHGPRARALEASVPDWRTNWQGQLDYGLTEPETAKYLATTFDTPAAATEWFTRHWERPADPDKEVRKRIGFLDMIGDTPMTPTMPVTPIPIPGEISAIPAAAQTTQLMSPWEDPMFWLSLAGGINPEAANPLAGVPQSIASYNKSRFEQQLNEMRQQSERIKLQQAQQQQQRMQTIREMVSQSIADPRQAALIRLGAFDEQIPQMMGMTPPASLQQVHALRSQYQSNPAVRSFADSSLAFSRMSETLADKENPFGSVGAVIQFMKSLDPGSTVTESETRTITGATGWETQLAGMVNRALGKGRFDDQTRRDILNISLAQLKGAQTGAENIWENYARLAQEQYRVDPSRVVFDRPEIPPLPSWAVEKTPEIPGVKPAGPPRTTPVRDEDVDDVLSRVEELKPVRPIVNPDLLGGGF